jgi:hypothetical protein
LPAAHVAQRESAGKSIGFEIHRLTPRPKPPSTPLTSIPSRWSRYQRRARGIPVSTGTFTVGGVVAAFVGVVILLVVFRALTSRGMLHAQRSRSSGPSRTYPARLGLSSQAIFARYLHMTVGIPPFLPLDTISQSVTGSQDLADAIADVAEGFCPICHVLLITHDGRACCPCGGCSYMLEGERFESLRGALWPPRSWLYSSNAFIALARNPTMSSRTFWAQSRQRNSLPRRSEGMSNARWLDSALHTGNYLCRHEAIESAEENPSIREKSPDCSCTHSITRVRSEAYRLTQITVLNSRSSC